MPKGNLSEEIFAQRRFPLEDILLMSFEVKTTHYLLGAASLVTALSWNTAVRETLNAVYPLPKEGIVMAFVYAIILTILLIYLVKYLPDTASELPSATQEKLKIHQSIERLEAKVARLERAFS